MRVRILLALLIGLFCLSVQAHACTPLMTGVQAALGQPGLDTPPDFSRRPDSGWIPVTLPDRWTHRWPTHSGTVWYRVTWRVDCEAPLPPLSLVIESINMAGEIHLNDTRIWQDAQLTTPLSRNWNMPRHLQLPDTAQVSGENTLWFAVQGHALESPGLGHVHLLSTVNAHAKHQSRWIQQRLMFIVNMTVSLLFASTFAGIWLLHRRRTEYGWFSLTNLAWAAFIWNVLATGNGPFPDIHALVRANTSALLIYVGSFCMLAWRLQSDGTGGRWRATTLACAALLATAALFAAPDDALAGTVGVIAFGALALFVASCVELVVTAARRRTAASIALAGGALLFIGSAIHDALLLAQVFDDQPAFAPIAGLLLMQALAIVLAVRIARDMRRIERFNHELAATVAKACDDLGEALRHEQALAVANSRLQARLQLTYDLHDGFGSALGRAIALAERHADTDVTQRRHLSTLRSLRDDLRQIIDSDASPDDAPQTPASWAAPVRHRFSTLFDALGIRSQWSLPPRWQTPPSSRQSLLLTRLLEEALANVVKHSHARKVSVSLDTPAPQHLRLTVHDDGRGFDVQATQASADGIGLRSMQSRAANLGSRLDVTSGQGGTTVQVEFAIPPEETLPPAAHH